MSKTTSHSSHEHAHKGHAHGHHGHEDHKALYTNLTIKNLPHSEVEITAEIPADALEQAYGATVKAATASVEMPGFRKGKAPEKAVVAHIGEMRLLEEAADDLISHEYQHIVIDKNIEVIDHPRVTVTKLARGNAIAFTARVAIFPTFTLSNPKELAKAGLKKVKDAQEVTDADVEKVVQEIISIHNKEVAAKKNTEESGGDTTAKTNTAEQKASSIETEKKEHITLTDELARTMGPFKDAAELRAKVRENLSAERTYKAKEQRRISIGDELVAAAKIDVPEVLITSEISRMWKEFEYDLSQMGLSMKDYLARIKKSEEDLRKEWHANAYKKVCLQIIINRIAIDGKINPDEKTMTEQIEALQKQHPDVPEERIRAHVETVLTNEAVFKMLEAA